MKQLRKDYTTTEQSKRLLELGLPENSADMYYVTYKREGSEHEHLCNDGTPSVINIHRGLSVGSFRTQSNLIPCWSVGRLIEIELICREPQEGMIPRLSFIYEDLSENGLSSKYLIESLVTYLEVGQYNYDFSKLEE